MPVTVESIKAEFPEFAHTSPVVIAAKIADATGTLHELSFAPTRYAQALKYQTAHLIALSPSGEFARLKAPDADGATTIYQRRLREIVRTIAGPMVA